MGNSQPSSKGGSQSPGNSSKDSCRKLYLACGCSGCKPFAVALPPCKSPTMTGKSVVTNSLKKGDLIKIRRSISCVFGIWHWLVYIGDNMAIHVLPRDPEEGICQCPDDGKFEISNRLPTCDKCGKYYPAVVRCDALDTICGDDNYEVDNRLDTTYSPLPANTIAETAKSLLGPVKYATGSKNCEHFAKFCRYGKAESTQSMNGWPNASEYLEKIKNAAYLGTDYFQRLLTSIRFTS